MKRFMTTPADRAPGGNRYFTNPENAAEMARLMKQSRFFTRSMGGLFPERTDLEHIRNILDVACGPGAWALDVASTFAHTQITGVDLSRLMIDYARAQAWDLELQNVHFRVMDVLKPLDFPDSSFDLVNARLLFSFLSPGVWPKLVQEYYRVTRPGGVARLIECEFGITNSPACERLTSMFTHVLNANGQSFSPDGRLVGITPMLGRFLRDAGYLNIQRLSFAFDFSAGMEDHADSYQDLVVFYKLMQPMLVKAGAATQEELDQLYQQALKELQSPEFCGVWFFLTVWGEKP